MASIFLGAGLVAVGMFASYEIVYRIGKNAVSKESDQQASRELVDNLHTATLGFFALLLAFTFSMALDRFNTRRQIILNEANSIGTTYLRADFLGIERAAQMKVLLRQYIDNRITLYESGPRLEQNLAALHEADSLQAQIWKLATGGFNGEPAPSHTDPALVKLLIESVNETFDHASERTASIVNQLPAGVLYLLDFFAIVVAGFLGYREAHYKSRAVLLHSTYIVLILAAMYVTFDLSRPKQGLVQAGHAPILLLKESLNQNPDYARFQ